MLASARRRTWRTTAASASPPACGCFVGRAISPAAEPGAAARFAGRCQHRPLRIRGKRLPDLAGYLHRQPATPPVCAFRRIHLPLQGRLCKRLPPKRLPCKGLRSRAPPAADTARRSRCSGRRTQVCFSTRSAMRAPQTGNVGVSRLRGAAPCPANTLPGRRRLPRSCGITELCGAALAQNRSITPPRRPCGIAGIPGRWEHRPAVPGWWLPLPRRRPFPPALQYRASGTARTSFSLTETKRRPV